MEEKIVKNVEVVEVDFNDVYNIEMPIHKNYFVEEILVHNSPNLVIDESCEIDDDVYATAIRMVGGSSDRFIIEVGNPWKRNHFFQTSKDPLYNKIKINWQQAVKQGRLDQQHVDMQRKLPFFGVLYDTTFPDADMVDSKGFSVLLSDKVIDAKIKNQLEPKGKPRLGVDVGRGGDPSVFVIRYDNFARVLEKNQVADLMYQVARIKYYQKEYEIDFQDIFIDDIGVGSGVTDRCYELDMPVTPVRVGGTKMLSEPDKFTNIRAEIYWDAKIWLEEEHTGLENNLDFYQLCKIKYKENSSSKLLIEPKDDLKKVLGHSPDVPDAFSLTFARPLTEPEIFAV